LNFTNKLVLPQIEITISNISQVLTLLILNSRFKPYNIILSDL